MLDRIVIIGNHRDAWVFGGGDPSSGTTCLMGIARALGQMLEIGIYTIFRYFTPKHNLDFCWN